MGRIMLVGGAGYIGSSLAPALALRGHHVSVRDLMWFGEMTTEAPDLIDIRKQDAADIDVEDLTGFDAVVFLAGLSNDPMADFSPYRNFVENAAIPVSLCRAARDAGVKKFILASSCSVYGWAEGLLNISSPTLTRSSYGIAKLMAEAGCMKLATTDFVVTGFRKGTVCGVSPRMRFDLVANTMVRDALRSGTIHVHDSEAWRPILTIEQAVREYIELIETASKASIFYNTATINVQIGHLATVVERRVRDRLGLSLNINIKTDVKETRSYRIAESLFPNEEPEEALHFMIDGLIDSVISMGDRVDDDHHYNIRIFRKQSLTASAA